MTQGLATVRKDYSQPIGAFMKSRDVLLKLLEEGLIEWAHYDVAGFFLETRARMDEAIQPGSSWDDERLMSAAYDPINRYAKAPAARTLKDGTTKPAPSHDKPRNPKRCACPPTGMKDHVWDAMRAYKRLTDCIEELNREQRGAFLGLTGNSSIRSVGEAIYSYHSSKNKAKIIALFIEAAEHIDQEFGLSKKAG